MLELLLDALVVDLGVVDDDRQPVVIGQCDLGPHVDFRREHELVAVVELRDLDLRMAEDVDLVLPDGRAVQARDRVLHSLVEDGATADVLVDHLRRHLAGAEALDPDLVTDLLVRRVQRWLELVERDFHRELDAGGAQGLDGALHPGVGLPLSM